VEKALGWISGLFPRHNSSQVTFYINLNWILLPFPRERHCPSLVIPEQYGDPKS